MKTDKRHWFVKESSTKAAKQKLRFSRKQRRFLDTCAGVEGSLDALFGVAVRPKVKFTERKYC